MIVPHGSQTATQQVEYVQSWWDVFTSKVQSRLTADCTGICAHLARLRVSPAAISAVITSSAASDASIDTSTKRRQWEAGKVDYMGGDSFDVIQKKLDEKINQ